jgi:hypothetical protein
MPRDRPISQFRRTSTRRLARGIDTDIMVPRAE